MIRNVIGGVSLLVLCWGLGVSSASAQSPDLSAPAAVRANQVTGTITARDLGDARLTDHYFAFTGTPGDLLITVESRNLNGDIDVFALTGMRPLLKFSVYEGSSGATTKSIYLRKREDLILRIEARTPNDDEGTYRVQFGGSFEPIAGGPENVPEISVTETPSAGATSPGTKSGKRGSRVSSVGARIYEPPVPEVAAAPTPEAEPEEKPAREVPEVIAPRPGSRTARGRRPARGRTRPAEEPTTEKSVADKPAETKEDATAATPAPERRTAPGRRRSGRRSATARPVEKPPTPPAPESGPRLVIETNDGTFIDRFMSSIRRVTVENGQVVVIAKDGKIQRIPLASVVRMSIAP